ncbi:MAG: hypothetical protein IIA85_02855 [Nanoarchaeota archaeon]|nr:hypothetical protein [Nanoarchaeota archaeon]
MKKQNYRKVMIIVIILAVVIFLVIISFYKESKISNFEECAAAGYPVGESYPRQCWTPGGKHFVEDIINLNRNYHSKDVEECSRTQILCVEGMKFFSDETGCGCEIVNDGKNFCPPESRKVDFCIEIYQPVCGWNDPDKIKCIKFPCTNTYSNSCFACMDENVLYYTEGVCPE